MENSKVAKTDFWKGLFQLKLSQNQFFSLILIKLVQISDRFPEDFMTVIGKLHF